MRRLKTLLLTTFTLLALGLTGGPVPTATAPAGAEPIEEPEPPPVEEGAVLSFSSATLAGYEGHPSTTWSAGFGVELSEAVEGTVTVAYTTVAGTATEGSDFTSASGTLTFAPGETSKSISVPVHGDWSYEPDETFTVKLSNATNATVVGAGTATMTIKNDDALIAPSYSTTGMSEGNAGTTGLVFGIELAAKAVQPVTVDWTTLDGTAKAGSDYVAGSGTVSWAIGERTKYVTVNLKGDSLYEPDESFDVVLGNPTGGQVGLGLGTIVIQNDDAFVPTLSIDSVAVDEGHSGTTTATLTASLSGTHTVPVTANYTTTAGTATAGSDFTAKSGSLTIPAGQLTANVEIPIAGDTLYEADETFTVKLSSVQNAYAGNLTGTVTITNDDPVPPAVAATLNGPTVADGDSGTSPAAVTVTLASARSVPSTIHYTTEDGTAKAGSDFQAVTDAVVTVPAGHTQADLPVLVKGDTIVEGSESFTVKVTSYEGVTFANPTATVTISDDDTAVLSVVGPRKYEGASGNATANVKIAIAAPAAVDQHFPYQTVGGTAVAGSDYVAKSGTLTIPAGATTAYVPVSLIGDTRIERDETFYLKLGAATTTLSTEGQATVTIANDDWPKVSVGAVTVIEPDRGSIYAKVPVRLSAAAPFDTKITFATSDGTAKAGRDYKARTVTVTIPAGRKAVTVSVAVVGDRLREANETFNVNLSRPYRTKVGTRTAKVTIRNDD